MIARIQINYLVKINKEADVRKEIIKLSEEVNFNFHHTRASNNWLMDIKIDTSKISKLFTVLNVNMHPNVPNHHFLGTITIGSISHSMTFVNSYILLENPSFDLEELK